MAAACPHICASLFAGLRHLARLRKAGSRCPATAMWNSCFFVQFLWYWQIRKRKKQIFHVAIFLRIHSLKRRAI